MLCLLAAATLGVRQEVRINDGWEFRLDGEATWKPCVLPHIPKPLDDLAPKFEAWQGVTWYRRRIPRPPRARRWPACDVVFEGAMQAADIYKDGKFWYRHTGGYLPFTVQLGNEFGDKSSIELMLRVDNRDDASFPPGRPQKGLDFLYSGGIYRNVWMKVAPETRIREQIVFAKNVSAKRATIVVRTPYLYIPGAYGFHVVTRIIDPWGRQVATAMRPSHATAQVTISRPASWDLDRPRLYRAISTLYEGEQAIDRVERRFGIRRLEFDHRRGVFLNGKRIRLEGANRHMAFPVVGNAASDEAQLREARLLKSYGLNILRLAHYPQSTAFLDACDEEGLLVIDPIPGWQFFKNSAAFKAHVLQDVREVVRRDVSHPCVAIFETCLNETYSPPDEFWRECVAVAKKEALGANVFTGGDSYGKKDFSKPIWDVPWTGWDDEKFTRPAWFKGQMGVDREYGDYEFGGEQSTSRVGRGDGEGALMLQAWNFIWSHNRNRGNPWSFGDLTWEGIDTHRGMNPSSPISKPGILDLYRLPKPVAYFFRSQGARTPMVKIANAWEPRPSPTKVVVFSNADEVELRLNGRRLARKRPDDGPTTGYLGPKVADPGYWAKGDGTIKPASPTNRVVGGEVGAEPFSGGNARNLSHPPFTFFGVPYERGALEAIAYRRGKVVARDVVRTAGAERKLRLRVASLGVPLRADGADFVFVYAEIVDEHGQVVSSADERVAIEPSGGLRSIGAAARPAEAGIAPFMVVATRSGSFQLRARTDSGLMASATIVTR